MTDTEKTVRRFLKGDQEAFNQLVRQWEVKIYNFAWRFLGNREDAQDVVQDTFRSALKSIRSLREPRSFPTWIYRIALNHCRARWRSDPRHISLDEPVVNPKGDWVATVREKVGGAECVDRLMTVDLIRKALAGITEEHRTAIILKEYMGLNLEEIATVMDCPLSTAKSRFYHGLREVQRNLRRLGVRMGGN